MSRSYYSTLNLGSVLKLSASALVIAWCVTQSITTKTGSLDQLSRVLTGSISTQTDHCTSYGLKTTVAELRWRKPNCLQNAGDFCKSLITGITFAKGRRIVSWLLTSYLTIITVIHSASLRTQILR